MGLDDIVHRVLPVIGPLAFLVAVARQHRSNHSTMLQVCALSLAVTTIGSAISAWLGLRFEVSHDLPDSYRQLYWWLTQWVSPLGYAVAGVSFCIFVMRGEASRDDA